LYAENMAGWSVGESTAATLSRSAYLPRAPATPGRDDAPSLFETPVVA
jgi:hypothetical protein